MKIYAPHISSIRPDAPTKSAVRPVERHLTEPALPFDYQWVPGEIVWPCRECPSWHVEVLLDRHQGSVLLREWHAADCSVWDLDGGVDEHGQT